MRRVRRVKGLAITLLAVGVVAATAFAATGHSVEQRTSSSSGGWVRWDIPQFQGNFVLAGGKDVSTDATTGDTATLTGSGEAEPAESEASGGGTFVHRHQDGTVAARGAYHVTGFISWRPLSGGSLSGTGLVDAIGNGTGVSPNESEEHSGVLRLSVEFVVIKKGQPVGSVHGVLKINCHLPGTTVFVEEGVEVLIPSFNLDFTPTSGVTLFHLLR
jgi:hypothetical protein